MEIVLINDSNPSELMITLKISKAAGASSLESEESRASLLNEVGIASTQSLLLQEDIESKSIEIDESPYGQVALERHVYQSSAGGKQYVPLELKSGMLGVSTPRWSKMVSWKYSNLPSGKVQQDLCENHQRSCCRTHTQSLSYEVGQELLAKNQEMTCEVDLYFAQIKSISIGIDGAASYQIGRILRGHGGDTEFNWG